MSAPERYALRLYGIGPYRWDTTLKAWVRDCPSAWTPKGLVVVIALPRSTRWATTTYASV